MVFLVHQPRLVHLLVHNFFVACEAMHTTLPGSLVPAAPSNFGCPDGSVPDCEGMGDDTCDVITQWIAKLDSNINIMVQAVGVIQPQVSLHPKQDLLGFYLDKLVGSTATGSRCRRLRVARHRNSISKKMMRSIAGQSGSNSARLVFLQLQHRDSGRQLSVDSVLCTGTATILVRQSNRRNSAISTALFRTHEKSSTIGNERSSSAMVSFSQPSTCVLKLFMWQTGKWNCSSNLQICSCWMGTAIQPCS